MLVEVGKTPGTLGASARLSSRPPHDLAVAANFSGTFGASARADSRPPACCHWPSKPLVRLPAAWILHVAAMFSGTPGTAARAARGRPHFAVTFRNPLARADSGRAHVADGI